MKNICKYCKYWNTNELSGEFPHQNFGFCEKLKIHEGEMYDSEHEENIPDGDINIVICTSEWFQSLTTSENFGCILLEQK